MVIEERTRIGAPVAQVWALVADPDRMAELSPEVHHISWAGEPGPRPGATFRGHNRVGPVRWATTNVIETVAPNSVFGWRTSEGNALCVSRWTYRIEAAPDGCRVVERYEPVSWVATTECLLGRRWMLRRGMRATLRRVKTTAEESDRSVRRTEIHQGLDTARATFHDLLDRSDRGRLQAPSNGTRWTNKELLFHMLFGYLVVRTLLPLVRAFGLLPPAISLRFAAALNAITAPFDVVNYYGSRLGASLINHRRMGRMFDRVIASLHRRLDIDTDAALDAQMSFPTRWDPFFRPVMTRADVYRYAGEHFEFHRQQLSLDSSRQ